MKNIISIIALVFLMGANCSQSPPVLSPNLDHISSAALVTCDAYLKPADQTPLSPRTCLVMANPFRQLIRAYDISQGQFLIAPIGYAPLAITGNGFTSQLMPFETSDLGYVFALDANLPQVSAISTRNQGTTTSSFSGVAPLSPLGNGPIKMFVTNPAGPANPELLAVFSNGNPSTFATTVFDPGTSQFGAVQHQGSIDAGQLLDVAYDAGSGLMAVLVSTGTQNNVVILSAATPALTSTIQNVGNVKITLGQINTSTALAPHLLLMSQDADANGRATLRTIRLNSGTAQTDLLDHTITLTSVAVASYFPAGAKKATCCGGMQEWLTVSADNGTFYYLTSADLQNAEAGKVFNTNYSLSKIFNLPANSFSGLKQIIGGDILILSGDEATAGRNICARQMFFIYSSGFVASLCEGGISGATQIVTRNTAAGT
jgi:hypothetical protein